MIARIGNLSTSQPENWHNEESNAQCMSLGTRLTAKVGEQRGEPKQGSCLGFLGGSWLALLPGQQTCSCAHKNRRRRLIEEQLHCTVLSVRVSRGALHP